MLPRIRIEAFAQSDALLAAIHDAARDRRAVRSAFSVHGGGFATAIEQFRAHPPADIVLIEAAGAFDELAPQIEALAEHCPPSTRLMLIGTRNDIVLYRRLMKIGVSDYLVQPLDPLTLLDAIVAIAVDEEDAKGLGLVLAFVGARGGAGSSMVAHNVASLLSRRFEATTLLVDADIGFGTAALQFDVSTPHDFSDAVKEREDLDREMLEKLAFWRDKRFGILTASDRLEKIVAPDPGVTRHIVDQARRLAQFVVLDLPQGWRSWTAEALVCADRVGLVATPDLPSLRNARTLLELIRKIRPNDAPPYLVLNQMPARGKPKVSADDVARVLDRRVAASIPHDDAAATAEMRGRVLVEEAPGSAAAAALEALAAQLVGREPLAARDDARQGPFGRLFARRRR